MNREIKFRGKTYNGRWIYGYCYKVKSLFDQQFNWFIRNDYQTDDMIIPETLGQCTGLKDKNGVEVYEGDIVRYHYKTFFKKKGEEVFDFKNEKCYVVWDIDGASFILNKRKDKVTNKTYIDTLYMFESNSMEIIGNIYENEEE